MFVIIVLNHLFNYLVNNNDDVCLIAECWLLDNIRFWHSLFNGIPCGRRNKRAGGVSALFKKTLTFLNPPLLKASYSRWSCTLILTEKRLEKAT